MSLPETPLTHEYDEPWNEDLQQNLYAILSKLLQYDADDTDDLAFQRNFREAQEIYKQLDEEIE